MKDTPPHNYNKRSEFAMKSLKLKIFTLKNRIDATKLVKTNVSINLKTQIIVLSSRIYIEYVH